jgi:hypothetical protein
MRPERSRVTARATHVARARLLVKADLAWLGGYPTGEVTEAGVAWHVPVSEGRPAQRSTIDRASLHRATRALTELEERFGEVLDDVVDAPRSWRAGVRCTLALLKPRIHRSAGGAADPLDSGQYKADLVARVRSAPAAARALLDAAAWIALVAPARLDRIAAWVLAHTDVLETLRASLPAEDADATAIHLGLLADAHGADRIAPLARLLGDAALFGVATSGHDYARQRAAHLCDERLAAKRPEATLGRALAAWTETLLGADARSQRRTLALLEALDLAPVAVTWRAWWARLSRCERKARNEREADIPQLRRKAVKIAEGAPRDLRGESIADQLTQTLAWDDATHREVRRALAALPVVEDGVAVRAAFLEHWVSLTRDARGKLAQLVAAFTRFLARTRALGRSRLAPWGRVLLRRGPAHRGPPPPEEGLLDDVATPAWGTFFEALARLLEADPERDLRLPMRALFALMDAVDDAGRAAIFAPILAPHEGLHWRGQRETVRVALALAGGDTARFGAVLKRLADENDAEYLLRAITDVRAAAGDDTACALVLEAPDALIRCGRGLATLDAIGASAGAKETRSAADLDWISAYPAWLGAALHVLARSDADAERTARRILGDDVRAASSVRRELAHLELRAAEPHIALRIDNLRARLERGHRVGPKRRARLVAKVERAARRADLGALETAVDVAVRAHLARYLALDPPPPWLFEPRTLEKISPIASFSPPMRALAIRVLRARAGDPPWDLRDDPANRAFARRLAAAGIDLAPWLDRGVVERRTDAKGDAIDLRLEDDPLAILEMGRHFSTCLSPGGINYFSAFANAADLDKRVLYARDSRGAVVGRCLLALTAAGGLLAFHPYAHDGAIGFDAIVRDFARDLATRMRTAVVPSGEVPRLVAAEWYDDGPIDLGGRFAAAQDGSPFRASIAAITPVAFRAAAEEAFAPLPLGAITLPILIALPELDARPDLVVALIEPLEASRDVPLSTLVRAVRLAVAAGQAAVAARGLLPRIAERLHREIASEHGRDDDAMALLTELSPSEALRVLRATRRRGVRRWEDETDPERLATAARAYVALRRPHRALTLYEHAASRAWHDSAARDYRARATALRAALG